MTGLGTGTLELGDSSAAAPSPAEPVAARVPYEPALDGLRAIAVFGVLVFHEHGPSTDKLGRGGFLGVDLFFVLSGYLITALLLRERANAGGIALGSFWRRRARRLLPALFVTIGLAVLYAHLYAAPLERRDIKNGIVPALFYFQNWHGLSQQASVLAPTWSLAIEEQWYLVWPVVLWLLLRRRARPSRALLAGVAGLAVVSAVWTWHVADVSYNHAYLGTDTRGQSLLVGACLALLLARTGRPTGARMTMAIDAAAAVALAFIVFAFIDWRGKGWFTFHGGILVVALASAALIVAATQPEGRLRKLLALRPLVAIGLISYGVYLYSFPMSFLLSAKRTHTSGSTLFVVRVVITLLFAYLSWRFIEQPIRRAPMTRVWPWVVIAAGVVLSLLAALTLQAPSGAAARRPPSTSLQTFLHKYHVLANAAPAGSERVLVVGGTEAGALDGMAHPYQGSGVYGVAAATPNCGVTSALTVWGNDPAHPPKQCAFAPNLLIGISVAYRPRVVAVTIEAADVVDRTENGRHEPVGSQAWVADATAQLDHFRKRLPPGVERMVVVGGCGPDVTSAGDVTARSDQVWAAYAVKHAKDVAFMVAPPTVCAHHQPLPAMWPWLARTVAR